jgi:hypothetical protein
MVPSSRYDSLSASFGRHATSIDGSARTAGVSADPIGSGGPTAAGARPHPQSPHLALQPAKSVPRRASYDGVASLSGGMGGGPPSGAAAAAAVMASQPQSAARLPVVRIAMEGAWL